MKLGSPKSISAYPKTILPVAASVGGLALFLIFASLLLVYQPIGIKVSGYFYNAVQAPKVGIFSSNNESSIFQNEVNAVGTIVNIVDSSTNKTVGSGTNKTVDSSTYKTDDLDTNKNVDFDTHKNVELDTTKNVDFNNNKTVNLGNSKTADSGLNKATDSGTNLSFPFIC